MRIFTVFLCFLGLFSVFTDQMPASIPHFSASHVWCLVISQGFRLSLEDPDTGHENGCEPKLTIAGTAGQQQEQQTNPWSLLRWGSVCWEEIDNLALFATQYANLALESFTHVMLFFKKRNQNLFLVLSCKKRSTLVKTLFHYIFKNIIVKTQL